MLFVVLVVDHDIPEDRVPVAHVTKFICDKHLKDMKCVPSSLREFCLAIPPSQGNTFFIVLICLYFYYFFLTKRFHIMDKIFLGFLLFLINFAITYHIANRRNFKFKNLLLVFY